ncbi:MAG: radical SAM protein [Planctomycetota bacterium]|nr:MAG: radical SAM protein [Planctomycetota bacterium]
MRATDRACDAPLIGLSSLDELWFQVAGTRCNLQCAHCFISCSPHNKTYDFLTLDDVLRGLEAGQRYGVREYYFTGGEPFLHPQLVAMLKATLEVGPATVLTNATVLKPEWLEELAAAEQGSPYSLEFRVSLDGPCPEINDPIRGAGTFDRAMVGVRRLVEAGFLPIITMTRTWDMEQDTEIVARFREVLAQQAGYTRARLKILPRLQIGAEARRTCGYRPSERVTAEMLEGFDRSHLLCDHARVITDRGVAVCPILLDFPDALLGRDLDEAVEQPFALCHGACYTCYLHGAICSNPAVAGTRRGASAGQSDPATDHPAS